MRFGHAHPCFSDRLVQEGAARSSVIYFHHGSCLSRPMVKLETENVMEAETSELVMVDCVFASVMNLLGYSGL
jgi:hypothetical protein